ncbi:hypothetical protein ACQR16_35225 [Bradyrhizobium oligotrophicum]|uniref:hypothetical protein n=1 Tax=Bradyrhizobium oligotrophicum TaxID=44255 RepID=UPI003EBAE9C5
MVDFGLGKVKRIPGAASVNYVDGNTGDVAVVVSVPMGDSGFQSEVDSTSFGTRPTLSALMSTEMNMACAGAHHTQLMITLAGNATHVLI